jgi:glycosyltransferase involved in cell wall biosynthesis
MKVLHLTTDSQVAGAERLLLLMTRHGALGGVQHVVCTLRSRGPLHQAIDEGGGTAFSLDLIHGSQAGAAIRRLLWLVQREQPDVLHTHLFHAGVLAWAASYLGTVPPRVHTRHYGPWLHQYGKRWQVRLDQQATRSADLVIAISHAVRDVMISRDGIPAERIKVVHNGIELPSNYRTSWAKNGGPRLVAVGTLLSQKGHHYLVEAMPLVRRSFPGASLRIYGEGPERQNLEHRVRSLGLDHAVQLPGYVDDVFPSLADADLMVHPSLDEGFGIALLVPVASPPHLAAAIVELLADAERRRKMGAAGRQRVEEHFTIGAMLKRYEELYPRVLSSATHEPRKAA